MRGFVPIAMFSLALTCVAAPALGKAQEQSPPRGGQDAAVEFYQRGRAHFEAGRYRQAADDLERARQLDPESPTLIYNLARVHELLAEYDPAITQYQHYLVLIGEEDTEERRRIQSTIWRLEGARESVASNVTPDPLPLGPPNPQREQPQYVDEHGVADPLFFTVAGLAVATLIGGTVTGIRALQDADVANGTVVVDAQSAQDRQAFEDSAASLSLASDILLISTGVLGVSAVLLYALRSESVLRYPESDEGELALSFDATGFQVGWRGRL